VTRARLGALAVVLVAAVSVMGLGLAGWARAQTMAPDRAVLTLEFEAASLEELLAEPGIRDYAHVGGAGIMIGGYKRPSDALVLPLGDGDSYLVQAPEGFDPRDVIEASDTIEVVLFVVGVSDLGARRAVMDETVPLVVATGTIRALLSARGDNGDDLSLADLGSITSDSTHRDGVVASADLEATTTAFFGELDGDGGGSPIEIIPGPPPFELHERYLAQRRMYVPIGTAAGIYLAIAGLGAIAVLALGSRIPQGVRRVFGWGCLSVAALATALLAAGHLPQLTYATVVPFVALVTVFGTLAFAPLERRDVLLVPAGIGIAVLAYFALEAILEWTAALTPFVGGSELDGGRFYGLPNVFIGLLIGSCLWVAHRLRTGAGVALLVAVALFAGLPYVGANLGGGVSLFAAAGLWLAVRERERLGVLKGLGVFVGVTLFGAAVILLAHAISPFETHVTRFEEEVSGIAGVFERFRDRLQVGFDLIARNPFALIPVLGLPVAIAAVLRPPAALRPSLQRSPAWRDAVLVTLLAGVVAYVVNDSGPAAAGLAFGLGLGGLLGVSLLSEAGKMGEP